MQMRRAWRILDAAVCRRGGFLLLSSKRAVSYSRVSLGLQTLQERKTETFLVIAASIFTSSKPWIINHLYGQRTTLNNCRATAYPDWSWDFGCLGGVPCPSAWRRPQPPSRNCLLSEALPSGAGEAQDFEKDQPFEPGFFCGGPAPTPGGRLLKCCLIGRKQPSITLARRLSCS